MILDTHAFLWWVDGDRRLSGKALRLIRETTEKKEDIGISAITAWEIAKLVEHGRIGLKYDVLEWLKRALALPRVRLIPLTPEIAVKSSSLPGAFHGDPADQIIVATAIIEGAPLITADRQIRSYLHVRTVW